MKTWILHCPFCGSKAELQSDNGLVSDRYYVECVSCKAKSNEFNNYYESKQECEEKAIESWNKRV